MSDSPSPELRQAIAEALYNYRGQRAVEDGGESGFVPWHDTSEGVREMYCETVDDAVLPFLAAEYQRGRDEGIDALMPPVAKVAEADRDAAYQRGREDGQSIEVVVDITRNPHNTASQHPILDIDLNIDGNEKHLHFGAGDRLTLSLTADAAYQRGARERQKQIVEALHREFGGNVFDEHSAEAKYRQAADFIEATFPDEGGIVCVCGSDKAAHDIRNGYCPIRLSGRWEPVKSTPATCGRIMLGLGTDTWDPTCKLPDGHDGSCKSSSARDQNRRPVKSTPAETERKP